MNTLNNRKVAILATDGFEQSELLSPKRQLEAEGATTHVVSLEKGNIRGWENGNWGQEVPVDLTVEEARADNYDALLIPGGVINPDTLRKSTSAVNLVQNFFSQHKPVASICHGPQMLIEADVVKDRKMTSYPSIRTDLVNAGAQWVDEEVVVDSGLVTSRSPQDLTAFNDKLIEEIREGKHEEQTA
ncbi:MAG: type 1 glutamine amidotransferase [Flavobacteriales bacterium]|nr:type 1 glutamine amidotransferase [Flavobacteriales bacterium]